MDVIHALISVILCYWNEELRAPVWIWNLCKYLRLLDYVHVTYITFFHYQYKWNIGSTSPEKYFRIIKIYLATMTTKHWCVDNTTEHVIWSPHYSTYMLSFTAIMKRHVWLFTSGKLAIRLTMKDMAVNKWERIENTITGVMENVVSWVD